jgi:hypothetical protein
MQARSILWRRIIGISFIGSWIVYEIMTYSGRFNIYPTGILHLLSFFILFGIAIILFASTCKQRLVSNALYALGGMFILCFLWDIIYIFLTVS